MRAHFDVDHSGFFCPLRAVLFNMHLIYITIMLLASITGKKIKKQIVL